MDKKRLYGQHIYIFTLLCSFVFLFFSCETGGASVKEDKDGTDTPVFYEQEGTVLKIPDAKEFMQKTENIPLVKDIEICSAASLRKAADYIMNNSGGLSEKNKFYLVLVSKFMNILYPYEQTDWTVPSYPADDKYFSAFDDIQKNVYPYWLDTNGFFSLVIPPLMLLKDNFPKTFYKDAEERIAAAKKLRPASVLPHYLEGRLYELKKDTAQAYASYKKAWETDQSCYPAGIKYAKLLAAQGRDGEALKIAGILQERFNGKSDILLLNAEIYISKRNWNAAEPFIAEVLSKEPENLEALLLRIEVLIEKREYMKANSLLKAYSLKNKTNKKYLLLKTRVVKEWNKNTAAAIQNLSEADSYYPEDFEVMLACAGICFETGEKINGKSADDFIRAVSALEPENVQIIRLLLKNDIRSGNWQKALEPAKKLALKYPSYEHDKLLLQVYLGSGKNREALAAARKLYLSSAQSSEEIISYYLESLYKTGDNGEIRKIISLRMTNARSEQKSVLHYYNALLFKNSDSGTYLSEMRSALLANPRNKKALFSMYEWHFAGKDYRNAQFYLRQIIALEPGNTKYIKLAENLAALLAR